MFPFPCYGIIPARYASTRLPAKALADICGKPMFWHVYSRACACPELEKVWLATDDNRIAQAAQALAVPCIMTSPHHASGSDRVNEAANLLNLPDDCVVVNIQGDEPLLAPEMLSDVCRAFADPSVEAATLAQVPKNLEEKNRAASANVVKVVRTLAGDALYFSRANIPFRRDEEAEAEILCHIGIYAFTREVLRRFTQLPASPLEKLEKLEQLRLLENNIPLRVQLTQYTSHGVDTPEDLEAVRQALNVKTIEEKNGR